MAETEQLRKIFVGGLNWETDEDKMKSYFSHWGTIVDCVIMRTPERTSRGFGFITYDKARCVDECLKEKRHELDGRQIEPKRAVPRDETNNPSAHQKTKKIFIGGLASTTTEEDIDEYFNKLLNEFGEGRIVDIDLKKDRDNPKRIRGFAYVTFDCEEVVEKLLIMRTHEIKMKQCEVKRAETQAAIRRRQERDGTRPVRSTSSRESSHSGPSALALNSMPPNMQGFGMGNWGPGFFGGYFGGGGSGERGSGRQDSEAGNRSVAKPGGAGGWGSQDSPAAGNWGGPFGGNFNPGAMGFGGFGPAGFGGFSPAFGFNPFAMASLGYGGGFPPGFGFGFGGFGPGGAGDRGSGGGDRSSGRGSTDYGSGNNQEGKGADSGNRERNSAYPGFTGYSNMLGQSWPGSHPGMVGAGAGSVADPKGGTGAGANPADAFPMGNYSQMSSSYGPSRNGGAWSVGTDGTNVNRMYKPY